MKKQYIAKVKRLLILPGASKAEVLRDLEEIFRSGNENGETDEQIIKRLGEPEEFVLEIENGLGVDIEKYKNKLKICAGILLTVGIIMLAFCVRGWTWRAVESHALGIIGGADGSTQIMIASSAGIDFLMLFSAAAAVILIVSVVLIVKCHRK